MQQGDDRREELRAMARDARGWVQQRGWLFWGVVLVLVLIVVDVTEEAAAPADEAGMALSLPAAAPIAISAAELVQAYAENEVAAQARFAGRAVEVTGRIDAITLDLTNDPVVRMNGASPVSVNFSAGGARGVADLRKGQELTVYCPEVTELLGIPVLSECTIVR